jgi:hypothetical protein
VFPEDKVAKITENPIIKPALALEIVKEGL